MCLLLSNDTLIFWSDSHCPLHFPFLPSYWVSFALTKANSCRGFVILLHGLNEHRFVIWSTFSFPLKDLHKIKLLFNILYVALADAESSELQKSVADTTILRRSLMPKDWRSMEWTGLVSPSTFLLDFFVVLWAA